MIFMEKRQIFAESDPLRLFKEDAQKKHPNCAFFNHEINGREFDINRGFCKGESVNETIITDGNISLQKKNLYSPTIVWKEHLVTLENGTSICITIENATFMIVITNHSGKKQVDIHVPVEDIQNLTNILNFFYGNKSGLFQTSSIRFTSPTILTLQNVIRGNQKIQTFDFSAGKEKEKFYRKRHGKRH